MNIISKLKDSNLKNKFFINIRKLATVISPRLNTKLVYYRNKGKAINLKKPQTFDEKISWLKLNTYNKNHLVIQGADKYRVREYIESSGHGELLNQLYYVYNHVDEISWRKLPDKFVLKWNVGAGGNIICTDKKELDIEEAKYKLNKWANKNYHLLSSEMQYKYITPKIVCEKYIEPEDGILPEDYKIYCFNGKAKVVMYCIGREENKPKFYFFDTNWNLMRINEDGKGAPENFSIKKPDNLNEMFSYAESLAKPFPFVRVDLYNIKGKIIFGELTFTPAAGVDPNLSEQADSLLGDLLELP